MNGRGQLIRIAVILVLASAAALKVARYADTGHVAMAGPVGTPVVERIAMLMHAEGWQVAGSGGMKTNALYDWIEFTRPDCPGSITVGLLGDDVELADKFRRDQGGAVAFLQGGDWLSHPSGSRRQFAGLRHAARRLLGLASPPGLPLLALSPAPVTAPGECQGPAATSWLRLAR